MKKTILKSGFIGIHINNDPYQGHISCLEILAYRPSDPYEGAKDPQTLPDPW